MALLNQSGRCTARWLGWSGEGACCCWGRNDHHDHGIPTACPLRPATSLNAMEGPAGAQPLNGPCNAGMKPTPTLAGVSGDEPPPRPAPVSQAPSPPALLPHPELSAETLLCSGLWLLRASLGHLVLTTHLSVGQMDRRTSDRQKAPRRKQDVPPCSSPPGLSSS